MVKTESTLLLPLGALAPAFSLPDTNGRTVSQADLRGRPLLVAFICNHCPFVKHIRDGLAAFGREYQPRGLAIVGINSNDATEHPDDAPAKMRDEVRAAGYVFPYLRDESQKVAHAFHAACTPDFFLFDKAHRLVYRGQFDDSRPGGSAPVTGRDLRLAADAVLAGRAVTSDQHPSLGCNIKWRKGNEPSWFRG